MNLDETPLSNRVILITGAAGKLGSIAAKACAQAGATVILLDKRVPQLETLYDSIVTAKCAEPSIYPLDLAGASEQHYHELAAIVQDKYNGLTGLIHSAAELGVLGPIEDIELSTWAQILNVNLNAPYLLTKALLPLMKNADDASIVFTSDSAVQSARAYWGAYGVSKFAIERFALILADECENSQTIRVNTLIPGAVDSPIRRRAYPGENRRELANPEFLAEIYVYLLGPKSSGITGKTIHSNTFKEFDPPCTIKKA